jgi:hypothetical protein
MTMSRRTFTLGLAIGGFLLGWTSRRAAALEVSNSDATAGIKAALERGAVAAVDHLGRPGGFLDNPKVHIPLPGFLNDVAKVAKFTGQQARVEELEVAMNRAAEAAVPEAKALLVNAAKTVTVDDARRILTGGDTSVTQYFESRTRAPLSQKFLPIVTRETQKVALAEKYDALAGKVASAGLVRSDEANLPGYVTGKALDGLYRMIGEEEKKIRQDPVGTGSAILSKVFGALK